MTNGKSLYQLLDQVRYKK